MAAAVAFGALLTGCSSGGGEFVVVRAHDGDLTAVASSDDHHDSPSMQARLTGELTIDDHGCLAVRAPDDRAYPILLPANTVFSGDEPFALEVFGVPHVLGDEVDVGGGYLPAQEVAATGSGLPGQCAHGEIFVVHTSGDGPR